MLSNTCSFRNIGSSHLECTGCKEKLLINFPECLSGTARLKLTCLYEDQLAELHLDGCPFRRDAQNYLRQIKEKEIPPDLVPAMFTQVWRPDEVLEILDPLRPCKVVRGRWEKVTEWLQSHPQILASIDFGSWKLPPMDKEVVDHFDFSQNGDKLLGKLFKVVCEDAESTVEEVQTRPRELELGALLIVLLGWTPDTRGPSSSSLHCSICHSKLNLDTLQQATSTGGEDQPSPKRLCQRLNAPVDSHRYYCPYVRGLPRRYAGQGMRLCDKIILRLLNEKCSPARNEESPVAATDFRLGIRKLLKDVISPSHSKLTPLNR